MTKALIFCIAAGILGPARPCESQPRQPSRPKTLADSTVPFIMAQARETFPTGAVIDVLRQRTGRTSATKRREMADSLVNRVLVEKGRSLAAAEAVFAISQAGHPATKAAGDPDPEALDRLIEIDRKLGGTMRSSLIQGMIAQDRPGRALTHLRSIATSETSTIAVTALFAMMEVASRADASSVDRTDALRHLREMWDRDLVPFNPARNELVCFAKRAGWPMRNARCHRG